VDENDDKPLQPNWQEPNWLHQLQQLRADADKGREPQLVPGRMGSRLFSIGALLERIVNAFIAEHAFDSPVIREATTEGKRLALILATADYVLATESVVISPEEKADLIRRAYAELFTYGPLDPLFADPRVTTILLEGADKASVRYEHGDLAALGPIFEDEKHLRGVVRRLLLDAGTDLYEHFPIMEVGAQVAGRRICVNLAAPPVTFHLNVDIRVHPAQPPTLAQMVSAGMMPPAAAELLTAIARSPHGVVVVGDTESGKTMLLGALASLAQAVEPLIAVERAGEMLLPPDTRRFTTQWPFDDQPGVTFGEQLAAALQQSPGCIVLDEVRADEPHFITPLLAANPAPRLMWAFRGSADSKRLIAALGMLARRADPLHGEDLVRALYDRLPFVVTVRRSQGKLSVRGIAEWQPGGDGTYVDLVELMTMGWEGVELTGKRPLHALDLPESFWSRE
jgi:Flp pilus assembly CpaF family ATPase